MDKKAVVTDAVEALGQHVQEQAADELVRVEGHGLPRRPAARVESTTSRRPRNLVWGRFCQGGALRGLSIFFNVSFLVRLGNPFPWPHPRRNGVAGARRRGQGWRLAPPARVSSLTGSSTTAHLLWSG